MNVIVNLQARFDQRFHVGASPVFLGTAKQFVVACGILLAVSACSRGAGSSGGATAATGCDAVWNQAGAISAVKGHDRGCNISIVGVPEQMKIHDAALGQKLGEVCNQLFALP